ncbi:hypothetical protein EXIGLDRAFT_727444 [Exidia glandulosa HHB12029]|uniref:Uncharacterized protein n=1 Tax=Exidia glandulosa HHB12029 TaxID=1314781 RepID=A0A165DDH1_EXIGL|nr:hypothetical protein EXIGLDRAFT_727444 [Exidia glandulosa HHB12029]
MPTPESRRSRSAESAPAAKPLPKLSAAMASDITTFLSSPIAMPEWKPDAKCFEKSDKARLDGLHIPSFPTIHNVSFPDLNLYALGRLETLDADFAGRFQDFVAGDSHLVLVNTSGSGKTRMLFETLYRRWGIYFSAHVDGTSNPYGTLDMPSAIDRLQMSLHQYLPSPFKEGKDLPLLEHNRAAVSLETAALLLSRLVVFDHFLDVVADLGMDEHEARHRWLLLQIRSEDCLDSDYFDLLANDYSLLDQSDLAEWIKELLARREDKLEFIAFDEAQKIGQLYDSAFLDTTRKERRPLLREVIVETASYLPHVRLIISGTRIDTSVVEEAINASHSARKTVRPFVSLGEFRLADQMRTFIAHFLGDVIPENDLQLVIKWFRGRHRFLTVFIEYVLQHGSRRCINVLDAIMFATTGFKRPGASANGVKVQLQPIMDAEVLDTSPLADALRIAIYTLFTQGRPALILDKAAECVGSGAAHFTTLVEVAVIDEPLVCLNMVKWVSRSQVYSTSGLLSRRLKDPHLRLPPCALPDGLAFALWSRYASRGVQLDELARFPGVTPPWAKMPAQYIITSANEGTRKNEPITSLAGPLVYQAKEPEDVMTWFQNAEAPFLVPDTGLGAELIFILETSGVHRVIFVHLDPFSTDRPHRTSTIVPTNPYKLYKSNAAARKQLGEILDSFSLTESSGDERRKVALHTLQIYAFVQFSRSASASDSPAAILRVEELVRRKGIKELGPQSVVQTFS